MDLEQPELKTRIITGDQGKENKNTFFARISFIYPSSDPRYQKIKQAYEVAESAFHNRYRDNGDKYFEHIRSVALIIIDYFQITDHRLIIAALLHDLVEDIPNWTIEKVSREFGEDIALWIDYLTKPDWQTMPAKTLEDKKQQRDQIYYQRWWQAPREAVIIKIADVLHNLWTIWDTSKQKKIKKIEQVYKYFTPLARMNQVPQIDLLEKSFMDLIHSMISSNES